jgi:hypothetical protein
VLWQGGARKRPLRLPVIGRYAVPEKAESFITHHPAFLPTTMLKGSFQQLPQMYCDRW